MWILFNQTIQEILINAVIYAILSNIMYSLLVSGKGFKTKGEGAKAAYSAAFAVPVGGYRSVGGGGLPLNKQPDRIPADPSGKREKGQNRIDKLKGEAFASPFSIFFFSYARMMTGSPVVPSMPAWTSTVLPSIWFT